ncbi:hypothetical protein GCM10022243_31810 [Saccharothrix violaceirubra]
MSPHACLTVALRPTPATTHGRTPNTRSPHSFDDTPVLAMKTLLSRGAAPWTPRSRHTVALVIAVGDAVDWPRACGGRPPTGHRGPYLIPTA